MANTHTHIQLPSEVVTPHRTNTAPQQGSVQPGDGSKIHSGQPTTDVVEAPSTDHHSAGAARVPFKEQVVGVAKKTRGTLLGDPQLKQHGELILEGKAAVHDDPSVVT